MSSLKLALNPLMGEQPFAPTIESHNRLTLSSRDDSARDLQSKDRCALKVKEPLNAVQNNVVRQRSTVLRISPQIRLNLFQHLSLQEPVLTTRFHNPIFIIRS